MDSVESALAAERGGAHRVELCSNLLEGGTTPSAGLIARIRKKISIALHVMIRPRGGDFYYSADEFEAMQYDVRTAKELGADGVVFGILEEGGHIDIKRARSLLELARPMSVTFHRAFDMSSNLDEALEEVINSGVDRVLTSGGEQTAEAGIAALAKLVRAAEDRIVIMAGSGINETNVARIIAETRVREVHASLKTPVPSPMLYRNERLSMGAIPGCEYQRFVVLENKVRELLAAASNTI
ncbi:MAG TPA: copper homeostasis protein CutC [Candidatus Angelobacter sp.]|nr:copper homeostasis protein CutC [Candidatus Angelobacter sp.]